MSEKAYSGDVIRVVRLDSEGENYKIGDEFVVDSRQSNFGACDDDLVMTTTEEYLFDGEYEIIEKVNHIHFKRILNTYLSKTNRQLLNEFKWGSEGELEFNNFMNTIRLLTE